MLYTAHGGRSQNERLNLHDNKSHFEKKKEKKKKEEENTRPSITAT